MKTYRIARMTSNGNLCYVAVDAGRTFLRGYAATFHSLEVATSCATILGPDFAVVTEVA